MGGKPTNESLGLVGGMSMWGGGGGGYVDVVVVVVVSVRHGYRIPGGYTDTGPPGTGYDRGPSDAPHTRTCIL